MTSNTLQIVVTNESLLEAITFNYEQLKTALSERLEQYRNLVVTEDAINAAKQDRANLNRLAAALKDKRLEIERKLLGDFVEKCKTLEAIVASASKSIDDQVKFFEQQVKDQKKADIRAIYDESIGDLSRLLPFDRPFDRLFETSWLNKTSAMSKIEKELTGKIETVRKDLGVIDSLQVAENIAVAVKDHYLRTLDLSGALSEKSRLEKAAADLAERNRRLKEQNEAARDVLCRRSDIDSVVADPVPECVIVDDPIPAEKQFDFRVWLTPEKKTMLVEFLKDNNIRYGKVTD